MVVIHIQVVHQALFWADLLMWEVIQLISGVFMTCMEIYGNGVTTGMAFMKVL